MLNAIEPASYVAPLRHLSETKDESIVVLRGRFGVVIFDDAGKVKQTQIIEAADANGKACGVYIPHGTWHTS